MFVRACSSQPPFSGLGAQELFVRAFGGALWDLLNLALISKFSSQVLWQGVYLLMYGTFFRVAL